MRGLILAAVVAGIALGTAASAQTLSFINQTNLPTEDVFPTYDFLATSTSSTLTFAGYDTPGAIYVNNASVFQIGSGANLLSGSYSFTPAISGSDSEQNGNSFGFGGTTAGAYDSYSTNFATTPGSEYRLGYELDSDGEDPNGLRISATNASAVPAAPEPATWAMMILGLALVGGMIYRQHRKSEDRFTSKVRAIAAA